MQIVVFASILAFSGIGVGADDKADVASELKKFEGSWAFESVEAGGKKTPAEQFKGMTVNFEGSKYSVKMGDTVVEAATMKLGISKSPKTMDATVIEGPNKGAIYLAIYELKDDTLKVCFDPEGKKRPTDFKGDSGTQTLVIHKRVKK